MQSLALKFPHASSFHQHRRHSRISSVRATTTQSLAFKSPHAPSFHQQRRHLSISSVRAITTSPPVTAPPKLNRYSSRITEPKSQGASQAVLYGVGLSDEDLRKPRVGISSVWYEGNTCNMHLLRLSEAVREGMIEAGMMGYRFNTTGVSDEISMGTRGMCHSLQSRDLIADSIEAVMAAQWYDANISIPGCDKIMPGTIMAMGRLNRPSIMVYGGTIQSGQHQGNAFDIVSAFQSYGDYVSGSISDEKQVNVLRNLCPGARACGGMYTANIMASAIETMGMSLPYSSSTPAEDSLKIDECHLAGKYLLELLKMDLKPRDIITEKSLRNAMVMVMALGGSTNAVLHLIAIARSVGLKLTLDDFQKISDKVPFLADLNPSGKYVMEDLHMIGGTPAVIRYLLEHDLLDGDCMTGKTLAENAKLVPSLKGGQQIIRPLENPIKQTEHIQNSTKLALISSYSGPALVLEGEEAMIAAISESPRNFKGKVVINRGERSKGWPGMPEMLTPTSAIMGAGPGKVTNLTTSHGYVEDRGLGMIWVICRDTMRRIGIDEQFQTLAKSIGIWEFLNELRECNAYVGPTNHFLSSFDYDEKRGRVSFQINNVCHQMALDQFNLTLGFPVEGDTKYNNEEVRDTWANITDGPRPASSRIINAIQHILLQYLYLAISNSIFTQAVTNFEDLLFFVQCMLCKSGNSNPVQPNVGHFLARNILSVVRNEGSTGKISLGGVVHFIARKFGEAVEHNPIGAKKQVMDIPCLRRFQIMGQSSNPLFACNGDVLTRLPLEPIVFEDISTWKVVRTQGEPQPAVDEAPEEEKVRGGGSAS